jgi:CxxC motif-containing protein (DUF1111 family)
LSEVVYIPSMNSPRTPRFILPAIATVAAVFFVAQSAADSTNPGKKPADRSIDQQPGAAPRAGGRPGDSLPELTQGQLNDFANGYDQFVNVETAESGLGPIYNNTSCANCHSTPAAGGGSAATVTRFGRDEKGTFDPLTELGGTLLQSQAIDPGALERIPQEANVIAQRKTTALFGAGLIEAIPDQDIQALATRKKADGVLGRAAMVEDVTTGQQRVGRFGWKAQQATLLGMAADEFVSEMGITNRYFPTENAPNGNEKVLAEFDQIADPEDTTDSTGKSAIDRVTDFMRLLAPPAPPKPSAEVVEGSRLFLRIGCAECHVPILNTGANSISALNHKPVLLYSDLLLHDMGNLNDGIAQGDALPNEMKTAPLWGLKFKAPYLHDGRAPTIADAITEHDGEASTARDRFNKLPAAQQRLLLDFLRSL